jgi:hypothetical protein
MDQKGNTDEALLFADWRQWLGGDELLSPGLREGYRRTLEGFEQFCRQRAAGQALRDGTGAPAWPTLALAREYVELQRLERGLAWLRVEG